MATIKKCDICGKPFDFGFNISTRLQKQSGVLSAEEILKYMYEIKEWDICINCYFKFKKIAGEYKNAY